MNDMIREVVRESLIEQHFNTLAIHKLNGGVVNYGIRVWSSRPINGAEVEQALKGDWLEFLELDFVQNGDRVDVW